MRSGQPLTGERNKSKSAETRDRNGDLQIFSLTLSQLSYRGSCTVSTMSRNGFMRAALASVTLVSKVAMTQKPLKSESEGESAPAGVKQCPGSFPH